MDTLQEAIDNHQSLGEQDLYSRYFEGVSIPCSSKNIMTLKKAAQDIFQKELDCSETRGFQVDKNSFIEKI